MFFRRLVRCDDGETYAAGRYDAPCFKGDDRVAWNSSDPVVATVALGYSDYSAHRSAGVVRSAGLGPATITAAFKGHSASLAIEVVSGVALTERATMDRPDDVGGAQIHFVYAVPVGGHDRSFDRAGDIAFMADQMQKWLQAEAGMTWRFDTYQGRLDVSFLPIQWQGTQDLGTIMAQFHKALEERDGQLKPHKKYAVFFDYDDAQGVFPVSGVASREVAVTLAAGPLHEHFAGVAIHEVIHTFGAVASCAPNSTPGMQRQRLRPRHNGRRWSHRRRAGLGKGRLLRARQPGMSRHCGQRVLGAAVNRSRSGFARCRRWPTAIK